MSGGESKRVAVDSWRSWDGKVLSAKETVMGRTFGSDSHLEAPISTAPVLKSSNTSPLNIVRPHEANLKNVVSGTLKKRVPSGAILLFISRIQLFHKYVVETTMTPQILQTMISGIPLV